MFQLGNLAMICAKRHDIILQIKDGEAVVLVGKNKKQVVVGCWDDNKIDELIYELNHGSLREEKI